jgi:hypothetical protein
MKEALRRFLPIGHLYERTTKTGNPYLTGKIAEQQVFLFLQDDGSWKVFLQVEAERAPSRSAIRKTAHGSPVRRSSRAEEG